MKVQTPMPFLCIAESGETIGQSNMFMKFVTVSLFALCAIFLASCSQRLVDFTVISSKNIPITEMGVEFKKAEKRVKGVDSKWSILFISGIPNMKEAIDRAIEKYPGAVALADGVIYSKIWNCILLGQNQYVVEGTPIYLDCRNNNSGLSNEGNYIPQQTSQSSCCQQKVQEEPSQVLLQQKNVMRVTHNVQTGETLAAIATAYGVSIPEIIKWNKLESNTVYKGMKLIIYIQE